MLGLLNASIVFLLEMPIVLIFFSGIAAPRSRRSVQIVIGLLIFECGAVVNCLFGNTVWINFVFLFCIFAGYGLACFRISLPTALLYSAMLLILCTVWEFAAIFLTSVLSNGSTTDYNSDIRLLIIIVTTSKLLFFISCMLLTRFVRTASEVYRYPASFYFYPLLTFFCLMVFWYIAANETLSHTSLTLFAVGSILMFLSSLLLFVIYQHNLEKEREYLNYRKEAERLRLEKTYYDILERQNQELMIYAHDTKNHLAAIQSLNKDPVIADYTEKLLSRLHTYTSRSHSGNRTLDVILDKYETECGMREIQFSYDVRSCNFRDVEPMDLVSIFGNLLDNAMEAADHSVGRALTVESLLRNRYSVLIITNSSDDEPKAEGRQLLTTKADPKLHGVGLKSVRKTLKKYGGDLYWEYDTEGKRFTMTVMLETADGA